MKLYHGTTETRAKNALKIGIQPRLKQRSNWHHSENRGNPRAVYLTSTYALYYAIQAGNMDKTDTGRLAVIEVETDLLHPALMVPDEDVLAQTNRKADKLPAEWSLARCARYYSRRLEAYSGQAEVSLSVMGTCGYLWTIPPDAITRVAYIDYRKSAGPCYIAMDAVINRTNFRLQGKAHQAVTAWAFGDPMPELNGMESFLCNDTIELLKTVDRNGVEIVVNSKDNDIPEVLP